MATIAMQTPLSQATSFKKTSTPTSKRKISAMLDLENMENMQHLQQSPSKANRPAVGSPATTPKKTFTGVNIAALSNQANIINNSQNQSSPVLPKAKPQTKVQTPKSASVSVIKNITTSATTAAVPGDSEPKPSKAALPQAVARRNARERNRVKQVNNGFAALRQHIPEEMAEAFEKEKGPQAAAATSAAAQKKLSKVETLRMAVEYIRNLESLLNISASQHAMNEHSFSFCDTSSIHSNSPSSPSNSSMIDEEASFHPQATTLVCSSLPAPQPSTMSFDADSSPIDQSAVVTTINGIPYLRLPQSAAHQPQLNANGSAFIDPETGDFIIVQDPQQLQPQIPPQGIFPADLSEQMMIFGQQQQSSTTTGEPQSNFVGRNLLAPACYQGAPEEFNGAAADGQSTARSPVPGVAVVVVGDGVEDRIKIERGTPVACAPSSSSLLQPVYVNTGSGGLMRAAEESPPKRHCPSSEQFSVVDQSGVIIRGSFIEIKQELPQTQSGEQGFPGILGMAMDRRMSPEILATATTTTESMYDTIHERLLQIKTEMGDEDSQQGLNLLDSELTEEHMIDAMEWWENERRCNSGESD